MNRERWGERAFVQAKRYTNKIMNNSDIDDEIVITNCAMSDLDENEIANIEHCERMALRDDLRDLTESLEDLDLNFEVSTIW